ncbi:GIY-YIG nuclease family protein [Rhodococcus spongiicola]|uniref:GIY-YIG nuclease family protein n=1 Tax=Rhodococcus spongiicola TaxID=2487352 RepID=A0A3S3CR96_9NOCA|nr:GIY-YIG nuclease family protein [Rhodococcus spongiicola]RVW03776.1 GIY-YIG nuclease family protein [Rhodococcus spongiicola]
MATVWTVPEDITRVLLAAPGIRDFLTNDEGRGAASDPKVRLVEFTAVVNSLHLNAGRTFTSVRDAAAVLFDGPAIGSVVVSDALRLAVMRVITAESRERKPAPNPLSPRVVENLGLYVYALRDPRDRSIFYVGVGRGNKIYSLDWDALGEAGTLDGEGVGDTDRDETRAAWIQRIRDIYAAGHSVDHIVLRHRIDAVHGAEPAAKELTHVVVDALRLLEHHPGHPVLTNLAGEPDDRENRAMSVMELSAQYSAQEAPDLPVPGALIRVPAAAGRGLTAEELYALARGPWRAGAAARNVADLPVIVFADNIVRAVYRASSWEAVGAAGEQEWRFTGAVDPELEGRFVGTRVTPDRAGLKAWPAHGWVQRLTLARPHGR